MPKQSSRKPGIHLHKTTGKVGLRGNIDKTEWYWILIAKNGKTIARSSETYKTKRAAVKSIKVAENLFLGNTEYYDHTGKEVKQVVY